MPNMTCSSVFVLVLSTATLGLAQGKITWETDFHQGLAKAKKEGKLVVACISMQGERVCDVIVEEHYADPKIVELSKHTVNLFCSPHGTEAQQEIEKRVRIDLLGKSKDDWMVAPQHVIFSPDGKVLSSVAYFLSIGELEWMWAEALRKHEKGFEWKYSDRVRAPAGLEEEKAATSKEAVKPPTRKELDGILREIKKGYGGYSGAQARLPLIVRHPSNQARTFVERILEALETSDPERIHTLQTIAAFSPRIWYSVVTPFVAHEKQSVRLEAIRTLARLGDKRAYKALDARWRREPSPEVKGALLLALVACGPSNARSVQLIPFALESETDEHVRVQATIAAASLESRDAVTESLTRALGDSSPKVRSAAATAISSRRDTLLADALAAALAKESDPATKQVMDAAVRGLVPR